MPGTGWTFDEEEVERATELADLPTFTEADVYKLKVWHVDEVLEICIGDPSYPTMTIHELPVIYDVAVTSDNTCYGEVIEVTMTHTEGAFFGTVDYDGAGWDDDVDVEQGTTTTTFTFAGESLDIGTIAGCLLLITTMKT